jgi:hypothetical protein
MNQVIFTDAVISKGYNDAPALRFNDSKSLVSFKIGKRIYDKNAKDNYRYCTAVINS